MLEERALDDLRVVVEVVWGDEAVELRDKGREVVDLEEGASVRVELRAREVSVVVAVEVRLAEARVDEGRDELAAVLDAMSDVRCLPVEGTGVLVRFLEAVCTTCKRPVVAERTAVTFVVPLGDSADPPVCAVRAAPVTTARSAPAPTVPLNGAVAFRLRAGRVALEALAWAREVEVVEFPACPRAVAVLTSMTGAAEALAMQARLARTVTSDNGEAMRERGRDLGERERIWRVDARVEFRLLEHFSTGHGEQHERAREKSESDRGDKANTARTERRESWARREFIRWATSSVKGIASGHCLLRAVPPVREELKRTSVRRGRRCKLAARHAGQVATFSTCL